MSGVVDDDRIALPLECQTELESSLAAERAKGLELRQLSEQAAETADALAREKTESQAARDQLAAEAARQTATTADLYRVLADTQAQLEAEQTSVAELRLAVQRSDDQRATAEASGAEGRAASEELHSELEAARADAAAARADVDAARRDVVAARADADAARDDAAAARAELEAARAEIDQARARFDEAQADLEEARKPRVLDADSASNEFREAAQRAEKKLAALVDLQTETIAKTAAARRDLIAAQAAASEARAEAEKLRVRVHELEAEGASSADLRAAVEQAEQKLASVSSVQVQTLDDHHRLERELTLARQEAAALRAELAASNKRRAATAKKAAGPKLASATEEEWASIRISDRSVLREPIKVTVNGAAGFLVDLSVDGCQLLLSDEVTAGDAMKLVLAGSPASVTCKGKVAWARPEASEEGADACYRAGVAFIKPDEVAIAGFIEAHRVRGE